MFAVRSQGRKCGNNPLDDEESKWEVRKRMMHHLFANAKERIEVTFKTAEAVAKAGDLFI